MSIVTKIDKAEWYLHTEGIGTERQANDTVLCVRVEDLTIPIDYVYILTLAKRWDDMVSGKEANIKNYEERVFIKYYGTEEEGYYGEDIFKPLLDHNGKSVVWTNDERVLDKVFFLRGKDKWIITNTSGFIDDNPIYYCEDGGAVKV